MAATTLTLNLSLLFTIFSVSFFGMINSESQNYAATTVIPSTCKSLECPPYDVVQVGNGYEIRRYNSPVWISTSPFQDTSLVRATKNGFIRLFDYIKGNNNYKQKIEMTAPVITEVSPNNGPFVVSFYVPKANQANPPTAEGLQVQRWTTKYAAVRQFGGFVSDSNVVQEAAALKTSIAGTQWAAPIQKAQQTSLYTVAQYDAPFQLFNRVNEICFLFDL